MKMIPLDYWTDCGHNIEDWFDFKITCWILDGLGFRWGCNFI